VPIGTIVFSPASKLESTSLSMSKSPFNPDTVVGDFATWPREKEAHDAIAGNGFDSC
jgi:hypothetical protein